MAWISGAIAIVFVQVVALCMIPLGLPGTWLQVIGRRGRRVVMDRPRGGVLVLIGLASSARSPRRSGRLGRATLRGSRRAAWGALIGGFR